MKKRINNIKGLAAYLGLSIAKTIEIESRKFGYSMTNFMYKPLTGQKVTYKDYFRLGDSRLHIIGILGGVIWSIGMTFNIIAAEQAGFAISYGLGQGATLVAALWGVFIWKEFRGAKGVNGLLAAMFLLFFVGLGLIILSRLY